MKKIFVAALLVNISFVGVVLAEDSTAALRAEVDALKAHVAQLEEKGRQDPQKWKRKRGDQAESLGTLLEGVQVSGTVDSIYLYNFNSPTTKNNVGRVFDCDSNSMTLNAAKLTFQKAASADSPVGFRTDLFAGRDAKLIHSAGLGESTDSFDLEQAYAEINVPSSKWFDGLNDIDFKVGKFVTLAGAEVIESKDNWNTSRSLLFGYAIPFAHTGMRASYVFDNSWDIILGVNNGWDVADDNNDAKTFETHVGFNNIELPDDSSITVAWQGYFGPEAANENSSKRALSDTVVTYKTPWKPLTLIYNFDYASEQDLVADGNSGSWYGHAGYARVDINDEWSIIGRGEYFNDEDGARLVSGTPAQYREFTATVEYRPWKSLITRLEYRNDHANKAVFDGSSAASSKNQDTISGEVIVSF